MCTSLFNPSLICSTLSLFRHTLKLLDSSGELVCLVVPHGHEALKDKLSTLLQEIEALFPGELSRTDSRTPGYEFLALHYTYYNRYHESVSYTHIFVYLCLNYRREMARLLAFTLTILRSKES